MTIFGAAAHTADVLTRNCPGRPAAARIQAREADPLHAVEPGRAAGLLGLVGL